MSMAFTAPALATASFVVNGAMHNGQLHTDVRIFNPIGSKRDVVILIPFGGSVTVPLPPHGIVEIDDIAGSSFKTVPDGPVTLQIAASVNPIVAAVRTTNGGFAEIHTALPADPARDGNGSAFVYGLPPGPPSGSILARSASGGSYQVTLRGSLGEMLAASALSLWA